MNEQLIEFLDKYGLSGAYSGGGDSGGIDEFDTVHTIAPEDEGKINMDALQDWVYEHTLSEYGGWAWNGSASGSIYYDKAEKTIKLEGSEDGEETEQVDERVVAVWELFSEQDLKRVDSVNIHISNYGDCEVRINILNGIWTDAFEKAEENIEEQLEKIQKEFPDDENYCYHEDQAYTPGQVVKVLIETPITEDKYWEIDLREQEYNPEVEHE